MIPAIGFFQVQYFARQCTTSNQKDTASGHFRQSIFCQFCITDLGHSITLRKRPAAIYIATGPNLEVGLGPKRTFGCACGP